MHNTLRFPRLLFEVLVRFGPGECFGVYFSIVCFSSGWFCVPGGSDGYDVRSGILRIIRITSSLVCFGERQVGRCASSRW